jgi:hypothetical protein
VAGGVELGGEVGDGAVEMAFAVGDAELGVEIEDGEEGGAGAAAAAEVAVEGEAVAGAGALEVIAGAFAGEDAVGEEGVPAGEGGGDHLVEDVLLDADGGVGWGLDFGGGEVGDDGGAFEDVVGDFDAAGGEGEEGGVAGGDFFDGGALEDVLPIEMDGAGEAWTPRSSGR